MSKKQEDEYYKYLAGWFQLSYEEQCEVPILTFDEWREKIYRHCEQV